MRALLATACLMFLVSGVSGQGELQYTPPPPPAPSDPMGLLSRLIGLTLLALAACGGILWLIRRTQRPRVAGQDADNRIQLEGSLALDARSALHIIRVDGQSVAVATDATGLRSLTLLQDSFESILAEEAGPPIEPASRLPHDIRKFL